MTDRWVPPDLKGRVAVVTGATRGVGRGIAEVLGSCGAAVYAVGRSTRTSRTGDHGTVDDVAEAITAAGGTGIPAPYDVADDEAISALFERVDHEQGRLDVVVNNAVGWSGDENAMPYMYEPAWKMLDWWWDANFQVGVRSHYFVTKQAAPRMARQGSGLVLFTSERQPSEPGLAELVLDLRATVVERMTLLWSLHLRPRGVASILLYPGFTRTEDIQAAFERGGGYFEGWTEERYLTETSSPQFTGRAAAVLAADPDVLDRTGALITSAELAQEFDFTDVNGRQPDPI